MKGNRWRDSLYPGSCTLVAWCPAGSALIWRAFPRDAGKVAKLANKVWVGRGKRGVRVQDGASN